MCCYAQLLALVPFTLSVFCNGGVTACFEVCKVAEACWPLLSCVSLNKLSFCLWPAEGTLSCLMKLCEGYLRCYV